LRNVGQLTAMVGDDDDTRLLDVARQVLQVLACQLEQIEAAITALERQLLTWHKTNAVSQRLASIPGIGPTIATAIAMAVADPKAFRSGREFAAWLGLVPRQNSTGGKTRLGGITKRGSAHRLGGDAVREVIPAQRCGGLVAHGTGTGACERAMTRDGTPTQPREACRFIGTSIPLE
jgi:Transposase IS116/IS110/IS902 family